MIRKRGILKKTRSIINITKNYYIAETPVTQGLYASVISHINNPNEKIDNAIDDLPEFRVSLEFWQKFISELNRITQKKFRIPTEAEWEYAAKGGHKSQGFKYSGSDDVDKVAWHHGSKEKQPQKVGLKFPNELGLFDMSGNIYEICSDWYSEDLTECELVDPKGPISGDRKVLRGGAWCDPALNSAIESKENRLSIPDSGFMCSASGIGIHGLRLVLDI